MTDKNEIPQPVYGYAVIRILTPAASLVIVPNAEEQEELRQLQVVVSSGGFVAGNLRVEVPLEKNCTVVLAPGSKMMKHPQRCADDICIVRLQDVCAVLPPPGRVMQ